MEYLIALNLPQYTYERHIRDIFKQYQCFPISVDFHISFPNKSAIISFRNNCNIKRIIELINKTEVDEIFLDLIYADFATKSFFINNKKTIYFQISPNVTSNAIKSTFEKFGKVEKFNYSKKSQTGSVTFEMTESALKAKNDLNQKNIKGNIITIDYANYDNSISFFFEQIQKNKKIVSLKNGNETSVFVFDIPEMITKTTLRLLFKEFNVIDGKEGVVIKTKFNYDSKLTKYAIITFDSKLNALKAIKEFNYVKVDGITIRLVLANTDTIKVLATNKGKLLISNLDLDITASQLHDALSKFGEVIECEIPADEGVSRGYGYVHFLNEKDAITAKNYLKGALMNGKEIQIDLLEEPSPNDQEKKYLKDININFEKNYFTQKDAFKLHEMFVPDFSLFEKNNDFVIYVNEKKIDCNRFIVSFFSPKIACNIQNDASLSSFNIKISSLDKCESINFELVNFLVSLLNENPSRSKLQKLINNIVEKVILSMKNECFEESIEMIIGQCSEFLLGNMKENEINDDYILNFILLIEVFEQLGNDMIIQYANSLLYEYIQYSPIINNDQVLYIKNSIRKIMKDSDQNTYEIEYIAYNFNEIDPQILNKIDSKTIEESIHNINEDSKIDEDALLYKILRLKDDYKKQFIPLINFSKVTNEAMKFFLSTIDFSIFNGKIFESISKRLSLKMMNTNDLNDEHKNVFSNIIFKFIKCGIGNSLSTRNINEKNFTIFIENDYQKIEINRKIATIISPIIKRNLQTDQTFSSFYLKLDSQIDYFNKFVQSLSYFISKENKIDELDNAIIRNKLFDLLTQMNDMIDKQGINYLIGFLSMLHTKEKNPINYAGWILLFIYLGNLSISEFLINLFIKSHDPEITSIDDVIERLRHKEVMKYNDSFEVDISSEKVYIVNNFEDFFTNVLSLNDFDENLWKILSIRLSVNVEIKSNEIYSNKYIYSDSSDLDSDIA